MGKLRMYSSKNFDPSTHSASFGLAAVLFTLGLFWSIPQAYAEYRLQAGDVIEVSVANAPELRQRAPVQIDGSITLPVVGTIQAEGGTLPEVRTRIKSALASKMFRLRTPDGREAQWTIEPEDVVATIVEYRPIFIIGDVSRAGEQPFRPRMTIRQALATAGGPLPAGIRSNTSPFEATDFRNEYTAAWLDLINERAKEWRIRTELGEKADFDLKTLPPSPVSDSTVAQVLNLAAEYRKTRMSDLERAKNSLRQAIQQADEQIGILTEQQQKEDQGVQEDVQELERTKELFGRGNLTSPRVTDARRAVLLSSTRKLQTSAQLMVVKRLRGEFTRELEKLDDQRKVQLLAELQESTIKITAYRTKVQAIEEKLRLAGMVPAREFGRYSKVDAVVFRNGDGKKERIKADYETELQPGDVLEITLEFNQVESAVQ